MKDSNLKAGVLLVANAKLDADPDFKQSVIFLTVLDSEKAFGFNIAGSVEDDWLSNGGPMETPLILLDKTNEITAQHSIGVSGYYFVPIISEEKKASEMKAIADHLRAIANGYCLAISGYAGWTPQQLEDEVEAGYWQLLTIHLDQLLSLPASERWQHANELLKLASPASFQPQP